MVTICPDAVSEYSIDEVAECIDELDSSSEAYRFIWNTLIPEYEDSELTPTLGEVWDRFSESAKLEIIQAVASAEQEGGSLDF
jgi:pyruvate-formate lyase-activating enzyme